MLRAASLLACLVAVAGQMAPAQEAAAGPVMFMADLAGANSVSCVGVGIFQWRTGRRGPRRTVRG